MYALLLVLLAEIPREPETLVDHVDRIELNHVQSIWDGSETLCQVIYWRWSVEDRCYHVAAWRTSTSATARFKRDGREWVETREDGLVRREIRSPQFRETWTLHDPELEDRKTYPPELRRGLRQLTK